MKTLSPWINFNGNAEEAFMFYKSVFGGEFTKIVRFKDLSGPEFEVPEREAENLMQIVLPIGDTSTLIGNDIPEFMGSVNENENRSKIHVSVDSREEAERIFVELSSGGSVEVAPNPEGAYFGMFRDMFGIEWIIEFSAE